MGGRPERGFTLAELVVVLVVVGILAVAAIPRLFDTSGFAARGARDFLDASLRYAQKSAVAMRRNVCVAVTGTVLSVTYASNTGSDQVCGSSNFVLNPGNGAPFVDPSNAFPGGATITSSASFIFDALGRPLSAPSVPAAGPIVLTVSGYAQPVTIEPETGYVH
jgi:MSHA pilin protein MshC